MRIPYLPKCALRVPYQERQEFLQGIVNRELHRRNICPVGSSYAGTKSYTVGVYRHFKKGWEICAAFCDNEEREKYLEELALHFILTA